MVLWGIDTPPSFFKTPNFGGVLGHAGEIAPPKGKKPLKNCSIQGGILFVHIIKKNTGWGDGGRTFPGK